MSATCLLLLFGHKWRHPGSLSHPQLSNMTTWAPERHIKGTLPQQLSQSSAEATEQEKQREAHWGGRTGRWPPCFPLRPESQHDVERGGKDRLSPRMWVLTVLGRQHTRKAADREPLLVPRQWLLTPTTGTQRMPSGLNLPCPHVSCYTAALPGGCKPSTAVRGGLPWGSEQPTLPVPEGWPCCLQGAMHRHTSHTNS